MGRRLAACAAVMMASILTVAPASAAPRADASLVTLSVSSTHGGTITSDPAGISCPDTCEMSMPTGTQVVLSAPGQPGVAFHAWGGGCSGTQPTCTFAIDATTRVTARFRRSPHWGVPHEAKAVTDPHELYGPLKGFRYGSWLPNPDAFGGAALAVTATNITTGTKTYVFAGRCGLPDPQPCVVTTTSPVAPVRIAGKPVVAYLYLRSLDVVRRLPGNPMGFQVSVLGPDSRDVINIVTQLNRFNR